MSKKITISTLVLVVAVAFFAICCGSSGGGDDGSSSIVADRARAKTAVYYAFEGIGKFMANMPHEDVFSLDSDIVCTSGSKEKSGDKITFANCVVNDGSDQYTMSGFVETIEDITPWYQYTKSAKVDIDLDITGDCWHNKIKSDHPYGYGIGDSVGQKEKYQDIDLRIDEDSALYRYHGFKVEIIGDSVEFDGLVTVESSGLYESVDIKTSDIKADVYSEDFPKEGRMFLIDKLGNRVELTFNIHGGADKVTVNIAV